MEWIVGPEREDRKPASSEEEELLVDPSGEGPEGGTPRGMGGVAPGVVGGVVSDNSPITVTCSPPVGRGLKILLLLLAR